MLHRIRARPQSKQPSVAKQSQAVGRSARSVISRPTPSGPKTTLSASRSIASLSTVTANASSLLPSTVFKRSFATAPAAKDIRTMVDTFANVESANYVEQIYDEYKKNPANVHVSWRAYFQNLDSGLPSATSFALPPNLTTSSIYPVAGVPPPLTSVSNAGTASAAPLNEQVLLDHMKLMLLIRAYQVRGHVMAKIDPLDLTVREKPMELQLPYYGFTEADLQKEFFIGGKLLAGVLASGTRRTLGDILRILEQTYCSTIGVEYMHIQDRLRGNWLRDLFETPEKYQFSKEDRVNLLDRLIWATSFERFLHMKYQSSKRFGLDGCEVMIPGLKVLIDHAAELGVENVVLGMAHRGRLNILANVVRKPLAQIFHEFDHGSSMDLDEGWGATGDVKYHLGTSYDRPTRGGKRVHLSLLANPSHLEAVNPVVEGKARAKQYIIGDTDRSKVMAIQIHGDASFAGQGVVYETVNMSGLNGNTTGGTIHIVINNQIGFTTDPRDSRGGMYCTDVVKGNGAPIFHVNADDPEAVMRVMQIAAEWRQKFKKDVVIDLVCYRRFGHNEADLPAFTQPLMYQKIEKTKPVMEKYAEKLVAEGVVTKDDVQKLTDAAIAEYTTGFEAGKKYKHSASDWLESRWEGFKSPAQMARIKNTGVKMETLKAIGKVLYSIPAGFQVNPRLKRILEEKKTFIESGKGLDWATAEALAFGSLLLEGNHVRLAGQDVERGTFSHRHAVWHHQDTNEKYTPLNNLPGQQQKLTIMNSCLSEFAELGFELGYSLESPNALCLWEAQFGDFSNGAQIILDQFISAGENKWFRQSGLTLLLPHGYEGAGPEHSSARLERFLQMSDYDLDIYPPASMTETVQLQKINWQIANVSTPANYFHILRRQIHRDFRKPLIIFTPKSLLRNKAASSDLTLFDDVGDDDRFQSLIPETHDDVIVAKNVRRVIFCTGKVYYDLAEAREKRGIRDIALVRIEQLAPFPFAKVAEQLQKYPTAEVTWVQEEPKNMGAWSYSWNALRTTLANSKRTTDPARKSPEIRYAGRGVSASPATASHDRHTNELKRLLDDAFSA